MKEFAAGGMAAEAKSRVAPPPDPLDQEPPVVTKEPLPEYTLPPSCTNRIGGLGHRSGWCWWRKLTVIGSVIARRTDAGDGDAAPAVGRA